MRAGCATSSARRSTIDQKRSRQTRTSAPTSNHFQRSRSDHDQPVELAGPVEPVGGDAGRLAPPQQHQRHRRHQRQAVHPGAQARARRTSGPDRAAGPARPKSKARRASPSRTHGRSTAPARSARTGPPAAGHGPAAPAAATARRQFSAKRHGQREIHESEQERKIEANGTANRAVGGMRPCTS